MERGVTFINDLLVHLELIPIFHNENLATFRLRCIIAHKILFSPTFRYESIARKMAHLYNENSAKFCIWCAMLHRQGFMHVYTMRANMRMLGQAIAPQSSKHIVACRIHGETNVTW